MFAVVERGDQNTGLVLGYNRTRIVMETVPMLAACGGYVQFLLDGDDHPSWLSDSMPRPMALVIAFVSLPLLSALAVYLFVMLWRSFHSQFLVVERGESTVIRSGSVDRILVAEISGVEARGKIVDLHLRSGEVRRFSNFSTALVELLRNVISRSPDGSPRR